MPTNRVSFGDFYTKSFVLELDEINTQSVFRPKEDTCYVRLFPGGLHPELKVSMGNVHIDATKLPLEMQEDIVFAKGNSQSLRYPMPKIISWSWIGRQGPTPQFIEDQIKLPQKFSGVLRVNYKAYYDRLAVTSLKEGKILLEVIKDDRYGYIALDWERKTRKVYLTVKCACTRKVLAGAKVWVDGRFVGITDRDGRIYLGELTVGNHVLRVEKDGYKNTDEDLIRNDEFTVPDK